MEPGSQVLLRTAGSLATESIIPSRWCSHGVMDITHDSLRQSRNSLVTRGPLLHKMTSLSVAVYLGLSPPSPTDTRLVSYYRLLFQPEGRELSGAGGRPWKGTEELGAGAGAAAAGEGKQSGGTQAPGGSLGPAAPAAQSRRGARATARPWQSPGPRTA